MTTTIFNSFWSYLHEDKWIDVPPDTEVDYLIGYARCSAIRKNGNQWTTRCRSHLEGGSVGRGECRYCEKVQEELIATVLRLVDIQGEGEFDKFIAGRVLDESQTSDLRESFDAGLHYTSDHAAKSFKEWIVPFSTEAPALSIDELMQEAFSAGRATKEARSKLWKHAALTWERWDRSHGTSGAWTDVQNAMKAARAAEDTK